MSLMAWAAVERWGPGRFQEFKARGAGPVRHLFASQTPEQPETTGPNRNTWLVYAGNRLPCGAYVMWIIVFTTVYIL
jgi:hypothetical protein